LKKPTGIVPASLRGSTYGTKYNSPLRYGLAWGKTRLSAPGLGRLRSLVFLNSLLILRMTSFNSVFLAPNNFANTLLETCNVKRAAISRRAVIK
jgi:hypothetical protein